MSKVDTARFSPSSETRAAATGDRPARAVGALILATLLFACSDVAAKVLTESLPAIQVTWLRYAVFCVMVLPLLLRNPARLRSRAPKLQVVRGLAMSASALLFIVSVSVLPVAEATALNFVAPIFIMLLALVFLGETVGPSRWIAAVVGLFGVVLIVQPGTEAFTPAVIFPLTAALVWAGAAIVTRRMSAEPTQTTLLYSAFVGLAFLTVLIPFQWVTPTMRELGIAAVVGVFATLANWLLIVAYRQAPASLLRPSTMCSWSGPRGWATSLSARSRPSGPSWAPPSSRPAGSITPATNSRRAPPPAAKWPDCLLGQQHRAAFGRKRRQRHRLSRNLRLRRLLHLGEPAGEFRPAAVARRRRILIRRSRPARAGRKSGYENDSCGRTSAAPSRASPDPRRPPDRALS
jgi:drug/metabolite transporter (DMT)-like permease